MRLIVRASRFGSPANSWANSWGRRYLSIKRRDPLRILFCGADPFSIASLKALQAESKTNNSILSIDVVTKKDKRTGRGLKQLTAPPIKSVALNLGLPLHQIDTFTGWEPPSYDGENIDLVVAVSFGLLIPPRILKLSKYGGLNVHPSLLPDLRGAAPIQWTIIQGRRHTGVSIQTLHPSKFDEGLILDQTPSIPIPDHETTTFFKERDRLAAIGAELLVKAIRNELYIPPYQAIETTRPESLAPRIISANRVINFETMTLQEILNKNRAIPKLFAFAEQNDGTKVRVVFETDLRGPKNDVAVEMMEECKQIGVGKPYAITSAEDVMDSLQPLFINTKEGGYLVAPNITVAGSPPRPGASSAARTRLFGRTTIIGGKVLHVFDKRMSI